MYMKWRGDIMSNNAMDKSEILFFNKLKKYNMNRYNLREKVANGDIVRIMHGVYANPDKDINEFWLLGQRYNNGIFSHNTALYFHNMTDRTPLHYDMTFPSNNRVKNESLKVHYIKKELHQLGLTKLKLNDDLEIKVYNIERTICDIIRDRNKIDPQIFNNAMKEYLKRKDKNLKRLYEYARKFKIDKILEKYMEVLL